jgi:hypothetical protein
MTVISALLGASLGASGQNYDYHRNNFDFGAGVAMPVGNDTSYLNNAPMVSFGYGYRFMRYLQADAAFQMAFGAANNQNAEITDIGTIPGHDHEFMIPLGGRVILPLPGDRVEVSAGGGAVYLHYSETVPSSAYYSVTCYTCTSRGGWGGYGLANVKYFLDDSHTFHIGVTVEAIRASLSGEPVGNTPAVTTSDHWLNLTVQFGMSF